MKTAKIYFEGNLVSTVNCKEIMFPSSDFQGFTIKDENGKIQSFVPINYMIIIEENEIFAVKGSNLVIPKMPNDRIG